MPVPDVASMVQVMPMTCINPILMESWKFQRSICALEEVLKLRAINLLMLGIFGPVLDQILFRNHR